MSKSLMEIIYKHALINNLNPNVLKVLNGIINFNSDLYNLNIGTLNIINAAVNRVINNLDILNNSLIGKLKNKSINYNLKYSYNNHNRNIIEKITLNKNKNDINKNRGYLNRFCIGNIFAPAQRTEKEKIDEFIRYVFYFKKYNNVINKYSSDHIQEKYLDEILNININKIEKTKDLFSVSFSTDMYNEAIDRVYKLDNIWKIEELKDRTNTNHQYYIRKAIATETQE
ncbi:hypothetical protein NEOKW01_2000 [Nematocida sp. AWRm80]|nr:hypothetical protein NEOKW01_2000 [Nematocida sp. AWRm80]